MKLIVTTKYIMEHSIKCINLAFTCRNFYIEQDKIVFNNYISILLEDIITAKAIINCYQSTLYDNEKKKVIPTTCKTSYISTKLDNVKNVLEEIKGSVIEWNWYYYQSK